MNCPICKNNASYYKDQKGWFCHSCNQWLTSVNPGISGPAPIILSDWETPGMAALSGFAMAGIGSVAALFYWDMFTFWPAVGFILFFLMCIVPLLGAILVLAGQLKIGGYLLMIGGVVMVPIGLISIIGGQAALKIDKINKGKQ